MRISKILFVLFFNHWFGISLFASLSLGELESRYIELVFQDIREFTEEEQVNAVELIKQLYYDPVDINDFDGEPFIELELLDENQIQLIRNAAFEKPFQNREDFKEREIVSEEVAIILLELIYVNVDERNKERNFGVTFEAGTQAKMTSREDFDTFEGNHLSWKGKLSARYKNYFEVGYTFDHDSDEKLAIDLHKAYMEGYIPWGAGHVVGGATKAELGGGLLFSTSSSRSPTSSSPNSIYSSTGSYIRPDSGFSESYFLGGGMQFTWPVFRVTAIGGVFLYDGTLTAGGIINDQPLIRSIHAFPQAHLDNEDLEKKNAVKEYIGAIDLEYKFRRHLFQLGGLYGQFNHMVENDIAVNEFSGLRYGTLATGYRFETDKLEYFIHGAYYFLQNPNELAQSPVSGITGFNFIQKKIKTSIAAYHYSSLMPGEHYNGFGKHSKNSQGVYVGSKINPMRGLIFRGIFTYSRRIDSSFENELGASEFEVQSTWRFHRLFHWISQIEVKEDRKEVENYFSVRFNNKLIYKTRYLKTELSYQLRTPIDGPTKWQRSISHYGKIKGEYIYKGESLAGLLFYIYHIAPGEQNHFFSAESGYPLYGTGIMTFSGVSASSASDGQEKMALGYRLAGFFKIPLWRGSRLYIYSGAEWKNKVFKHFYINGQTRIDFSA